MIPPTSHNNITLVLRRTFTASRQRVFRAWITPQALEHWLRPGGKSVTVRSLDAQVGGSFHFELEDGNSIVGTYLHIVPPKSWYLPGQVKQSKVRKPSSHWTFSIRVQ